MSIIPPLGNFSFDKCVLPYEFESFEELAATARELDQKRALCGVPIHSVATGSEPGVGRIGINSDPLDKLRRTETVLTAEQVLGPVAGVGEASLVLLRPRAKIPRLGLPISNYFPDNPSNTHVSYFGDKKSRVAGIDGVGVVIFDERVIMVSLLGRRLIPVSGVLAQEASSLAKVAVAHMKKSVQEKGEYIGPIVGY